VAGGALVEAAAVVGQGCTAGDARVGAAAVRQSCATLRLQGSGSGGGWVVPRARCGAMATRLCRCGGA
jgi:hypothetical protein